MKQWLEHPKDKDVGLADVLGLLVDAEAVYRDNRKLQQRLKSAKLKQQACVEDIDYMHATGLSKALILDRWGHT